MKSSIDLLGIDPLKLVIRKLEGAATDNSECAANIDKVKATLSDVFVQLKELV